MKCTPSRCQRKRAASDAGFTLLELLVSLTLLALIAVLVPSLVRMAGRSVRFAGDLTRAQSEIPALDALADQLSQARPLKVLGDNGKRSVVFSGSDTSVSFVAPGIIGGSGGLVMYHLALTTNRAGLPVPALSRTLFDGDYQGEQSAPADIRFPMPATRRLAFRYFGSQDSGLSASWSDHWDATDIIPQNVEISAVTTREGRSQTRTVTVTMFHYEPPAPTQRR